MSLIVNDNKLNLILTSYGLNRIAEALENPSETLNLSKIKVGDANGSYYIPTEAQTQLRSPIQNGSFYVVGKNLLEDNLTVSFQVLIPETFDNCEIREVGLYETINDEDFLFAICTQQPLLKPSTEYNYFIAVDYYLFLKSANLAEIYDQIILNPDNQLITEEDLQELMGTMLFTQGNLSNQIGKNSHIIGLNRPTQLYEQIIEMRDTTGYSALSGNFATFSGLVGSSNVLGYWVFNYPRKNTSAYSIADLSISENSMSTSQNINLFEQEFQGVISTLKFEAPSYYYLSTSAPLNFYNEMLNEDYPFTMMFLVNPVSSSENRTLLAKSNYATGVHSFEIKELRNGAVEVKLFSDESNYLTFLTPENVVPDSVHVLAISYNIESGTIDGYINGKFITFNKTETGTYTHISQAETLLYGYSFTPYECIYADSPSTPTKLFNSDGSPYTGTEWVISEGDIYYEANLGTYEATKNKETEVLYAWIYDDGVYVNTVYTKTTSITGDTVLYNEDYTEYTGTDFGIYLVGSNYVVQYQTYLTTYNSAYNIQPVTLYAYMYYLAEVHIWANSNTEPTVLFNNTGDLYTGTDWTIVDGEIHYMDQGIAEYDSTYNINIPALETTSFIVDSSGNRVQYVNSEIGIIAVAKMSMSTNELRLCVLELLAALGKNPCITVNE